MFPFFVRSAMGVHFRGTYEYTMDSKGRVAVPKKFREGLLGVHDDYMGKEIVVTCGLSSQLFVFSPDGFDDFARRYDALPSQDAELLDRYFGAGSFDCVLDAQGRILIPNQSKVFAGLTKDVVWVGQRGHVELWSADRWKEAVEAVQKGIFLTSNPIIKEVYAKIDFNSPL